MNEKLLGKLLETKSLIITGGIAVTLTVLTHLATSAVLAQQAIPCFFILGQAKMPDKITQAIMDKENM